MKPSRAAAMQAASLESMAAAVQALNERLARVEAKLDAALPTSGSAGAGAKGKPAGKPAKEAHEEQEA